MPRGRLAEDGVIDGRYTTLIETNSADVDVRTRRNVEDTDATLIIAFGDITGGTLLAKQTAVQVGRPYLIVDLASEDQRSSTKLIRDWIASLPRPLRLNVAGPRASTVAGAYTQTATLLRQVFR